MDKARSTDATGIDIPEQKDVPLFHVDPERPDRFVRRLNGKTEYGVLRDGQFEVTEPPDAD